MPVSVTFRICEYCPIFNPTFVFPLCGFYSFLFLSIGERNRAHSSIGPETRCGAGVNHFPSGDPSFRRPSLQETFPSGDPPFRRPSLQETLPSGDPRSLTGFSDADSFLSEPLAAVTHRWHHEFANSFYHPKIIYKHIYEYKLTSSIGFNCNFNPYQP